LGVVIFVVASIIAVTGEHAELGVNLFTAEVGLIAGATIMLLWKVRSAPGKPVND